MSEVFNYGTAEAAIAAIKQWVGATEGSAKHKDILNIYNSYTKAGVGTSTPWCAITVSAALIKAGCEEIAGVNAWAGYWINIRARGGRWYKKSDKVIPNPGWIVIYKWPTAGPDVTASHVGMVVEVEGNKVTVVEGNTSHSCAYREYTVGSGDYRDKSVIGYAAPAYRDTGEGYFKPGYAASGESSTTGISLTQTVSKLYSSNNFEFTEEKKKETSKDILKRIAGILRGDSSTTTTNTTNTNGFYADVTVSVSKTHSNKDTVVDDAFTRAINDTLKNIVETTELKIKDVPKRELVKGNLTSYPTLVQAPYIELDLNGVTIGGYNNDADKYPNHLISMDIDKVNGRINNYTINIVHQIRAGEDPNLIDTLLSRTGYRNKVKIKYGDSAYSSFFKEEEAYIIDVTHTDNVSSASINYTIKAISSVGSIQSATYQFSSVIDKPSNQIIKLLYENASTSSELLGILEGMRNKSEALGKNLIPQDDDVISISGLKDASLIDRITQLVSIMRDSTDPSVTYTLTYIDGKKPYFKIGKIKQTNASKSVALKNCYYVDVGFPGDSFVTNFSLNNDVYWPMYYKYAGKFSEYRYNIDYSGNIYSQKIHPLELDDKFQTKNVSQMNWWEYVRSYPVSASLTIKGLMKPAMLIENIYIYSTFYGQEDLATGIYSIIGQKDKVDGSGYSTTLELLKVS